MKSKQPDPITQTACATLGITSTVVRVSAGVLAGLMVGYFVLTRKGMKWQKKETQKKLLLWQMR